jgi:predicted MFS family arabinose efflux permease
MFGPLNLFTIMSGFTAIIVFAYFGARDSTAGLIVVTVLYGVASGSFISLLGPALFGFAKTQGEVGKRVGMAFTLLSVAALTGSPIGGALFDRYGFGSAIVFCGVMIAFGAVLIGLAAVLKGREKGTRKV